IRSAVMPPPSRRSRLPPKPPKIMAQRPMLASIVIAPAMVAATELIRMSRLLTCPSSCARAPSLSSSFRSCRVPWVPATEALCRFSSRRERIRRVARKHINLGHGNTHLLCEALHDRVDARQLLARDRLRTIHGQGNLVGIEVRDEVHYHGECQRNEHPVLTAE